MKSMGDGIFKRLSRAPNQTLRKRDLRRAARRLERECPGRWNVGYLYLLEQGIIAETGTGAKGDPLMVSIVPVQNIVAQEMRKVGKHWVPLAILEAQKRLQKTK